jgi:hypothetical protein
VKVNVGEQTSAQSRAAHRENPSMVGERRQDEAAAEEQQTAADERELTTNEEKMPLAEPQVMDLQAGTGESANRRGHLLGETETAQDGLLHIDLNPEKETETPYRSEEECKLARLMKTGMKHLMRR